MAIRPSATETRVYRKAEAFALTDAWAVQFTIGDAAAISNAWQIDNLTVTQEPLQQR